MVKTVTYGDLRKALETLGYRRQGLNGSHTVFQNPARSLFISLPELSSDDVVRPIDMLRVQRTLTNDGVIKEDGFAALFLIQKGDHLIWSDPQTQSEMKVTAAASESDGMVIIKQRGAFMACPVSQLRRDQELVPNSA